jgi:hypothetical protein
VAATAITAARLAGGLRVVADQGVRQRALAGTAGASSTSVWPARSQSDSAARLCSLRAFTATTLTSVGHHQQRRVDVADDDGACDFVAPVVQPPRHLRQRRHAGMHPPLAVGEGFGQYPVADRQGIALRVQGLQRLR